LLFSIFLKTSFQITNVNTIRLMHEQSKILPRFWIDDVYVSGMLLYGFENIKWFDFTSTQIKWSTYDFWDLIQSYEIYIGIKKFFFNFNIADYYKSNHFVIMHVRTNDIEIDYDKFNDKALNSVLLNALNGTSQIQSVTESNFVCIRYDNKEKNLTLTSDFLNCYNTKKNFYNYHFNHFCHQMYE